MINFTSVAAKNLGLADIESTCTNLILPKIICTLKLHSYYTKNMFTFKSFIILQFFIGPITTNIL